MWLAEGLSNPNFDIGDALVWPIVKYVEDPADIADTPITMLGKIIGTLVGVIGVAIFAVPAGLIGSGMLDAMDDDKHEKKLQEYRRRMQKSFRRTIDLTLKDHLKEAPPRYFVPQRIPLSRIQIRQGLEMKDIFDTCQEYSEFRMKNLAEAISEEMHPEDRFVVEHFPLNRPYGYARNRHSKVTVVSTSSFAENGTGWFTYYLAKMGGFNYISKDLEVDPDELDSFYSLSDEPLYNKRPISSYNKKKDKEAIELLEKKDANRKAFFDDLRGMATGADSWVIIFVAQIKNSKNKADVHFADAKWDKEKQQFYDSIVAQQDVYQDLRRRLTDMLQAEFSLQSEMHSKRYSLGKNNLGYRMQQKGITCNTFVLRPSCDIVNFDNRRLVIAHRMASVISEQLDGGRGIQPNDISDLHETGFGYNEPEDGTDDSICSEKSSEV